MSTFHVDSSRYIERGHHAYAVAYLKHISVSLVNMSGTKKANCSLPRWLFIVHYWLIV